MKHQQIIMLSFIIISVIPFISCDNRDNADIDPFYTRRGFSFSRLPLIKPYELSRTDDREPPYLIVQEGSARSHINSEITEFEVSGGFLIGKTEEYQHISRLIPQKWFIFNLTNGDKYEFLEKDGFLAKIHELGIPLIEFKTANQHYADLAKHGSLHWFPTRSREHDQPEKDKTQD